MKPIVENSTSSPSQSKTEWLSARCWLWLPLVVLAGCSDASFETEYGKRDSKSVNGTSVLAAMFEQSGHKVSTWRRLSPRLESCNTIVWAPDDFDEPGLETREYLEGWLEDDSGRTLIYIGRDFDPLPGYWSEMLMTGPAEQRTELARRQARALLDCQENRQHIPVRSYARWFVQKDDGLQRQVTTIGGPWAEGVDQQEAELTLGTRYEIPTVKDIPAPVTLPVTGAPMSNRKIPRFLRRFFNQPKSELRDLPDKFEVLLEADQKPFVTRITDEDWDDGKILCVANGSFVLNMPLVNTTHRKWAQMLIDECGSPGKVIFLESGNADLRAYDRDTSSSAVTKMEFMGTWPSSIVLLHFLALGIIFCVMVYPIFGRAGQLPQSSPSDFGRHIDALGELLEKSGDADYARHRITYYLQHVKR